MTVEFIQIRRMDEESFKDGRGIEGLAHFEKVRDNKRKTLPRRRSSNVPWRK